MIDHVLRYVLPTAYALLPPQMNSAAASAFLLAVGLQESGFEHRRQLYGGPARGFLMFERGTVARRGGVTGILLHPVSRPHVIGTMATLKYKPTNPIDDAARVLHAALEHNDTLTFLCGRVLLLTVPRRLPDREESMEAWEQYVLAWNPGAVKTDPIPHLKRWMVNYPTAWDLVMRQEA